MDFFEQQHSARRHTGLMVLMFLAAVAAIVVSINVVGIAVTALVVRYRSSPDTRAEGSVGYRLASHAELDKIVSHH